MTILSHSPGSTPAGILFPEEAEEFEPLFSESPLFRNKEDVLFGRAAHGEGGEEA